ncbi:hypothetical protein DBR42_28490 [Pelomonas sp. HMWF004]|nr:hypothetical protein DBR42_28490 [Pelomonas sp. HMWF004]
MSLFQTSLKTSSKPFSVAGRTPLQTSLLAGMACALSLALTAGPAMAETTPGMARVEVQGRMVEAPVRYDVHAACAGLAKQLQNALQTTWVRERRAEQIHVQLVMNDGAIGTVSTRSFSPSISRSVRKAVAALDCGTQAATGTQVYRFRVDFIDPFADTYDRAPQTAGAEPAYRIALGKD